MAEISSHTIRKSNLASNAVQRVGTVFRDRRAKKKERGNWMDRYYASGPGVEAFPRHR